jgi:hypothetical protein
MSDVFLSYRRADINAANGLHRELSEFAPFIDRNIRGGKNYPQEIREALDEARVVVALIGKGWMSWWNRWRLRRPGDWVHFELARSLQRGDGVTVIPVLIDDVEMPGAPGLPQALEQLCFRQKVELRADMWSDDVSRLVQLIREVLAGRRAVGPTLAPDAPYLCDRTAQMTHLATLTEAAKQTRSMAVLVHGHQFEGHSEFLQRLRSESVLKRLFGSSSKGIEIYPLEWEPDGSSAQTPAQTLKGALEAALLDPENEPDKTLDRVMTSFGRPAVFSLSLTWSELQRAGVQLLTELERAWSGMVAALPAEPSDPLLLWINLRYADVADDIGAPGIAQVDRLNAIELGDIQRWLDRADVSVFMTADLKLKLLGLVDETSAYCLKPGQIHMMKFAKAVDDIVPGRKRTA